MAKRVMLLPLDQIPQQQQNTTETSTDNVFSTYVELLPKTSQRRAKLLLHSMKNVLNLDESGRVQYADGAIGSSLYDHLRYLTVDVSNLKNARPIPRPFDAEEFAKLMHEAHVPSTATVLINNNNKSKREWKNIF